MAHFLANLRSWTASESTPQTAWKIGTCISQVTARVAREMRWHELKWIEMTPHRLKWDSMRSHITRPRGPEFPGQTLESKNRLPGRPRSTTTRTGPLVQQIRWITKDTAITCYHCHNQCSWQPIYWVLDSAYLKGCLLVLAATRSFLIHQLACKQLCKQLAC